MKPTKLLFLLPMTLAPFAALEACSSDSTSSGTNSPDATTGNDANTGTDTGVDTGVDATINDPQNCVAPGSGGNEIGIGGYCSPGGHQCDFAGPNGAPRICSADVSGTPAHAWFCTYPCSDIPNECGSNEVCIDDARGSGCIPVACEYLEDGGLETNDAGDAGDD